MNVADHTERGLADLVEAWGLRLVCTRRIRKVWRLETDQGPFCLKRTTLDPSDLLFVQCAVEHLQSRGFSAALPAIPTRQGACCAVTGEASFLLYPWRASREADFERPDDLCLAARVLALLHTSGRGFVPYRSDPDRVRWGLWPVILAARRDQMVEFGQRASAMARQSPFCAEYARLFPHYRAEAELALAGLDRSPYAALTREAVRQRTICHHDFSARNLLLGEGGCVTVVDFDYCLCDLRVHDLANLILRLLRRDRWQPARAVETLRCYHQHSPLDEREYAVLHQLLQWPQDFWQIGLQFFLEELPWPADRFLRTLRGKTEDRAERTAFLAWFAGEYGIRE